VGDYQYAATNLLTGQVLHDRLPLAVSSCSASLNGGGTLNGTLPLSEPYEVNAPALAALDQGRSVLWVLDDGYPVWCGINWDSNDSTRSQPSTPVTAQTFDSLWSKRVISDTIEYDGIDLFDAFRDLLTYGLTKQSGYITPDSPAVNRAPGLLAAFASNGRAARLILPDPDIKAGVPWAATYTYSDRGQIGAAWQDMAASGGLEYAFVPGLDPDGELAVYLQLAYTQLGRPQAESGIVFAFPGNCSDYGWPVTRSQGSNWVWASAAPNGSAATWQSLWPHGVDQADLDAGYPIVETSLSWQGSTVTSQPQVNNWADGQVAMRTAGMVLPTFVVPGGVRPGVKDIVLGDGAWASLTSDKHPPRPDGSPGIQQVVRITGWNLTPPGDQQQEVLAVTTSAIAAS
jgi:hypothetical protein